MLSDKKERKDEKWIVEVTLTSGRVMNIQKDTRQEARDLAVVYRNKAKSGNTTVAKVRVEKLI